MPGVWPSWERIISASPWRSHPLSGAGSSTVIGITSSEPSSTPLPALGWRTAATHLHANHPIAERSTIASTIAPAGHQPTHAGRLR